jgi:hypothetical protein
VVGQPVCAELGVAPQAAGPAVNVHNAKARPEALRGKGCRERGSASATAACSSR